MKLRGQLLLVALFGLLSASVVNGQFLRRWLKFRVEGLFNSNDPVAEFAIIAEPGLNAPSRFELGVIDATEYPRRSVELQDPDTRVFTQGALKEEADEYMSKVLPGFSTRWGKQFMYDDPKFQAVISFVQATSLEIGLYMKISKSENSLNLHGIIGDPQTRSNTGTPGEYAYVLSRASDSDIYSPVSPVSYSNYHIVATPESPLQDFIKPQINGLELSFKRAKLTESVEGEEGGLEFTHSVALGFDGDQQFEQVPRIVSRSSGSADMAYVAGLTSKISGTFVPVEALFIQMSRVTDFPFDPPGRGHYDVDVQAIYAVDATGRPAMVVNIGESRESDLDGMFSFEFLNVRNYRTDTDRSYENRASVPMIGDTERTSNVNRPGTWAFVVSEDSRELLYNNTEPPVGIEDPPSLFKFCSDDISGSPSLALLGWKGRFRKKLLRYVNNKLDSHGLRLLHYARYQLRRGGRAMKNYEIGVRINRTGLKTTLRRMCVVSDSTAMSKIAQGTSAAGLDDTLVPEMALVFEYDAVLQETRGRLSFAMEQVFASYADRETIAVITNYPSDPPEQSTRISVWANTQCGESSVSFWNNSSNSNIDGRFLVVFDGSERYRRIAPSIREHASNTITCDDYAGPCNGECPAGFTCQVKNGKNFCVNCELFERVRNGQSCCKVDADTNECRNNFLLEEDRKCLVAEPDLFELSNGSEEVLPVTSLGSVCGNRLNFIRNGAGCILQNTFSASGNRKCYFPEPPFFRPVEVPDV